VDYNSEYISSLRKEYQRAVLNPGDLPAHPADALKMWFDFAVEEKVLEPNAMVLSTVSQNRPSSRVVLLKELRKEGLVFFTNYLSRKGSELAENPWACVNFFWPELERQVRVEGFIEKISAAESEKYFYSRPRISQAGAIVSQQSAIIDGRDELDRDMRELLALPDDVVLSKPEHWGGYLLNPDYFEFWQGRAGRVHDRIAYKAKEHGIWDTFRLSP
jgi:pyridoxamine 5'-phosphate oxidase